MLTVYEKDVLPPFAEAQYNRYQLCRRRLECYTTAGLHGFLSEIQWNIEHTTCDSAYLVALCHVAQQRSLNEPLTTQARNQLSYLENIIISANHESNVFDSVECGEERNDRLVSEYELFGIDG